MHINALFRGNPSNSTYICSVWSPKNGKFMGNPWRNPRVGPKQKALGAPRSHLQPSAWEDLEDVRYRWHVPPSRSGWFHGIPMGFQLRQFTADRIICVISHGHKTGENSALLLGGFPENCSDFYWTSEIWKNSKHLSLDSDPRFFLSTRMLLELFFLRLSEGTPACKKEPIPKDVTSQLGSSKRKRWGASGRLFFQFRALLCHVFLIDPNAL